MFGGILELTSAVIVAVSLTYWPYLRRSRTLLRAEQHAVQSVQRLVDGSDLRWSVDAFVEERTAKKSAGEWKRTSTSAKPARSHRNVINDGWSGHLCVGSRMYEWPSTMSAVGFWGLADEHATRSQLRRREVEESAQIGEHEVLDDVDRGDRTEAAVGLVLEIRQAVALHHVEPARLRLGHHPLVEIDAAVLDACFSQRGQQAAGTATDVDDGRMGGEQLGVSLGQRHRDRRPGRPGSAVRTRRSRSRRFRRLGRVDGDDLRRRGCRPHSLRPSQLTDRVVEALDLVAQLGEAMRGGADARVRGDRVERGRRASARTPSAGAFSSSSCTPCTRISMERVVRGRKELDVRVEDAERVD